MTKPRLSPFVFDPQGPGDRPETGVLENFGVGVEQGLERTRIGLLMRSAPWWGAGSPMTQDEFEQSFGHTGMDYRPGMTHRQAEAILAARRQEGDWTDIESRRSTAGAVSGFIGNIAGSLLDPVNLVPFGAAAGGARSLGGALLRGAVLETGIPGLALTSAEAGVRNLEQNPMTQGEFAASLGMQIAIGSVASLLGHGVRVRAERLMDRARVFGVGIDQDGNDIARPIGPARPPPVIPDTRRIVEDAEAEVEATIQKITPDNLRKIINRGVPIREIPDDPYPGLMRNFGFNRQARPDLRDAELIERFYGPNAVTGEIPVEIRSKYTVVREPDGVRAILDQNGNRIEVPKNRSNRKGYHYADDAPPRREVAESNRELRDQLEQELLRGGKSARTREDRLRNIELVHRKLRERADRTADDPEWKPGQPVPEGVLVVRRSHGNELRLKEIPIGDETAGDTDNFWWPRAMELRTQRGRTNWAGLREDIAVLTRKQFSYFVHNTLRDADLDRLLRARGLNQAPTMTKAERGDLLFDDLHRREFRGPGRPETRPAQRETQAENLGQADQAVDQALARDEAARIGTARAAGEAAIARGASPQEVAAAEAGLERITSDNAEEYLRGLIGAAKLEDREYRHTEIANMMRRAKALKNKKNATKQALACLIGSKE